MPMSPRLRKLALAVHLTASVGWIGAVAAYLVLDLTVATSDDVAKLRSAWVAMDAIATWTIVPLALTALVTGLLMALGTKWGLFRHYWVLVSFVLTVLAAIVLLSETRVIAAAAAIAADATATDEDVRAIPNTLVHSIGGLTVLLVVQVLNLYKPPGLTPYGWRKQREEKH